LNLTCTNGTSDGAATRNRVLDMLIWLSALFSLLL